MSAPNLITVAFSFVLKHELLTTIAGKNIDLTSNWCRAPSEWALLYPRVLGCANLLSFVSLCAVPRPLSSASKSCSVKTGTVTRSQTFRDAGRRTSYKQCPLTITIQAQFDSVVVAAATRTMMFCKVAGWYLFYYILTLLHVHSWKSWTESGQMLAMYSFLYPQKVQRQRGKPTAS